MPALHPRIAKITPAHQAMRNTLAKNLRVSGAQGVSNKRIIGSLERSGIPAILKKLDRRK